MIFFGTQNGLLREKSQNHGIYLNARNDGGQSDILEKQIIYNWNRVFILPNLFDISIVIQKSGKSAISFLMKFIKIAGVLWACSCFSTLSNL